MIIYNVIGKLYEILFKSYIKKTIFSLNKRFGGVKVALLGLS